MRAVDSLGSWPNRLLDRLDMLGRIYSTERGGVTSSYGHRVLPKKSCGSEHDKDDTNIKFKRTASNTNAMNESEQQTNATCALHTHKKNKKTIMSHPSIAINRGFRQTFLSVRCTHSGHPLALHHANNSRCPLSDARRHASSSQGQKFALHHCRSSRCPPAAA